MSAEECVDKNIKKNLTNVHWNRHAFILREKPTDLDSYTFIQRVTLGCNSIHVVASNS